MESPAYVCHPSPHAHAQLSQSLKFLPSELLLLGEEEGFTKTLFEYDYDRQERSVAQSGW